MIESLPPQGWECPKCGKVNGPRVESCACLTPSDSFRERLERAMKRDSNILRRLS